MKEINALLESAQMNKTPIRINVGECLNPKVLSNIYILISYIFSIVKVIKNLEKKLKREKRERR